MKALTQITFLFATLFLLNTLASASVQKNTNDTSSSVIAVNSDWIFDNMSPGTELTPNSPVNTLDTAPNTTMNTPAHSSLILIIAGILSLGIARHKIHS